MEFLSEKHMVLYMWELWTGSGFHKVQGWRAGGGVREILLIVSLEYWWDPWIYFHAWLFLWFEGVPCCDMEDLSLEVKVSSPLLLPLYCARVCELRNIGLIIVCQTLSIQRPFSRTSQHIVKCFPSCTPVLRRNQNCPMIALVKVSLKVN